MISIILWILIAIYAVLLSVLIFVELKYRWELYTLKEDFREPKPHK